MWTFERNERSQKLRSQFRDLPKERWNSARPGRAMRIDIDLLEGESPDGLARANHDSNFRQRPCTGDTEW